MESVTVTVLDHGLVKLVDSMGSDLSVVRSARVSYNAHWRAGENESADAKLIGFLWRNQHMTPFESVTLTFYVKAPLFVLRQWHRHRTQSYNELSARYRETPNEFYVPRAEVIGQQSKSNKQTRDIDDALSADQLTLHEQQVNAYRQACESAFSAYRHLLDAGMPRELARAVLPLSTYSEMFATMNLRNLFHFLTLRDDLHAQWEIRQYAIVMKHLAWKVAPICVETAFGGRPA